MIPIWLKDWQFITKQNNMTINDNFTSRILEVSEGDQTAVVNLFVFEQGGDGDRGDGTGGSGPG